MKHSARVMPFVMVVSAATAMALPASAFTRLTNAPRPPPATRARVGAAGSRVHVHAPPAAERQHPGRVKPKERARTRAGVSRLVPGSGHRDKFTRETATQPPVQNPFGPLAVFNADIKAAPAIHQGQMGAIEETIRREAFISLADRKMIITQGGIVLASYPVAIGRSDYPTPAGEFRVIDVDRNPSGAPGVSTRWMGFLHTTNKAGPVELGIHGTDRPESIGEQASHGCIRLRKQDAIEVFNMLGIGDRIHIVSTPLARWRADELNVPAAAAAWTPEPVGLSLWFHPPSAASRHLLDRRRKGSH